MRLRLPSIPFDFRGPVRAIADDSRELVQKVKALPLPDKFEWLGLFVVLAAGALEWFNLPPFDFDRVDDDAPDLATVGPKTGKDAGGKG